MKKLFSLLVLMLLFVSIAGCDAMPGEGEAIYEEEYVSELEAKVEAYELMMKNIDEQNYQLVDLYISAVDQGLLYEDYLYSLGYERFIDDSGYLNFAYENDYISYDPYDESSKAELLEYMANFSSKEAALEIYG